MNTKHHNGQDVMALYNECSRHWSVKLQSWLHYETFQFLEHLVTKGFIQVHMWNLV